MNSNITSEETVKDSQILIDRNRRILDAVYVDTENLKKDKSILENDIARITKHLRYIEDIDKTKNIEIEDKTKAIEGLDIQITDKSKKRDIIESEVNVLETSLIIKRKELSDIEIKYEGIKTDISKSIEDISKKHDEVNIKSNKVEEKVRIIEKLLSELK